MIKAKKRQFEKTLIDKVLQQLIHESDRSVAIVGMAYLEDMMKELLQAKLIADTSKLKKIIIGLTAERCINLCYMVGLINRGDKEVLTLINGIRNDFAHDVALDTFDKYDIPERCERIISVIRKHQDPWLFKICDAANYLNLRFQYGTVVSHYMGKFGYKIEVCERFTPPGN